MESKGLNPAAILSGWLTGLCGLGCALLVLGLLLWQVPVELSTERWLGVALGALAAFAAGVRAGHRCGGSGLLHGLLAGGLLLLTQIVLAAVWAGVPTGGRLVWMAGLAGGGGAMGGVLGVNLGR